jgi:hypothetical protein
MPAQLRSDLLFATRVFTTGGLPFTARASRNRILLQKQTNCLVLPPDYVQWDPDGYWLVCYHYTPESAHLPAGIGPYTEGPYPTFTEALRHYLVTYVQSLTAGLSDEIAADLPY